MTLSVPSLADRLGVSIEVSGPGSYRDSVQVGLRVNPKRAHLLVSRLLGKHVPVPAVVALDAGRALGNQVRAACGGRTPVVLGFAETATALGHAVASVAGADGGPAPYLHTTRRRAPAGARCIRFEEEHSHAVDQMLAVLDDRALRTEVPLVLVDDEFSTGRTAINAIRALQGTWPRRQYVLASLLDSRGPAELAATESAVAELGARLGSVSLTRGRVRLPADVHDRAAGIRASLRIPAGGASGTAPVERLRVTLTSGTTGAHGWTAADETALQAVAAEVAGAIARRLPGPADARTLVLGDEEFMYVGQLVAAALGPGVMTSATTRSPAVAVDEPGYPLRTVLRFPSSEDGARPAFAYNVAPSTAVAPGNAPGFEAIVLVTDQVHTDGLVAALATAARRAVLVVQVTGRPAC